MTSYFLPFLILLIVLAAVLRDNFVFTLLYLFTGSYLLGQLWSRRALAAVRYQRRFTRHVFFGETISIRLNIKNIGWLPVIWLRIHESLPVELAISNPVKQVFSMGAFSAQQFEYALVGRKRGFYRIGPASLYSGEPFGLVEGLQAKSDLDYLTVFPKIVPMRRLELPSRTPLGEIRYRVPFFEDPSRVVGKRDYVGGDSFRRVDWKATASTGRMQVKVYESSISLETAIFLNLNARDYDRRSRFDATELAITAAASLASWGISQKQAVGLYTNGLNPWSSDKRSPNLPPRKGRGQLLRILESMAKLKFGDTEPVDDMIRQKSVHLSWGTTLVLVTGEMEDTVYDVLFQSQRRGLGVVIVLVGPNIGYQEIRRRAAQFGIPVIHILKERDLSEISF